jgi:hypothetical protein
MTVRRFATALLCVLLAGCLPVTTKTPVGTTAGLGADPALCGMWKAVAASDGDIPGKATVYTHFVKPKNGALTALQIFSSTKHDDDGWETLAVQTSTLGTNHYLNAVWQSENGMPLTGSDKDAIFPLRYTIKGRTLTLYMLDEEKAKAEIKAGKIAGTIESGNNGDVKITADPKDMDTYFARPEAAKLYKLYMVLKRVE